MKHTIGCPECGVVLVKVNLFRDGNPIGGVCPKCRGQLYFDDAEVVELPPKEQRIHTQAMASTIGMTDEEVGLMIRSLEAVLLLRKSNRKRVKK